MCEKESEKNCMKIVGNVIAFCISICWKIEDSFDISDKTFEMKTVLNKCRKTNKMIEMYGGKNHSICFVYSEKSTQWTRQRYVQHETDISLKTVCDWDRELAELCGS